MPDGTIVLKGPNGYLKPQVPCDHCGRPIKYYKGPYDQFPWFCSPECAAGEAIKVRCESCLGALRKPILFGIDSSGHKWVVCKSCVLRINKEYQRFSGMATSFLKFAFEKGLHAVFDGSLKMGRFEVVSRHLIYVPKGVDPTTITVDPDPTLRQQKRVRAPKAAPLVETRLERVLRELKERGTLDQDGRFKENSPFAGKLYVDIYPDA